MLKFTWFEFGVRLVGGAILGAMFGFEGGVRFCRDDRQLVVSVTVGAVTLAVLAVVAGDGFWQWFLGRWWTWH